MYMSDFCIRFQNIPSFSIALSFSLHLSLSHSLPLQRSLCLSFSPFLPHLPCPSPASLSINLVAFLTLLLFLLFVGSPLGLSHHDLTFCAALQVHYVHFKFPKKGVAFEAAASTTVFGSLVSPREDFHPGLSSHGRNRFAAALSLVIFEYFLKCLSEYYFCLKLSRAV